MQRKTNAMMQSRQRLTTGELPRPWRPAIELFEHLLHFVHGCTLDAHGPERFLSTGHIRLVALHVSVLPVQGSQPHVGKGYVDPKSPRIGYLASILHLLCEVEEVCESRPCVGLIGI